VYSSDRLTLARYRTWASSASHSPVRVWTLFAIATWVCRFGSPARESRCTNTAASSPRTSTCRTPSWPCRVNTTRRSADTIAAPTAASCATRIAAANRGSATAQSADTDLGGVKVRSNPATEVRGCEVAFTMNPCSSRGPEGSRPYSRANHSRASSVRNRSRTCCGTGSWCSSFHADSRRPSSISNGVGTFPYTP